MHECSVRDGGLFARTHIQRVDAFEIHKCGARHGGLVERIHIQRVDAFEMHKCGVSDLITPNSAKSKVLICNFSIVVMGLYSPLTYAASAAGKDARQEPMRLFMIVSTSFHLCSFWRH